MFFTFYPKIIYLPEIQPINIEKDTYLQGKNNDFLKRGGHFSGKYLSLQVNS